MSKLTEQERNAIEKLGDPLYNADFVEEQVSAQPASVFANAPLALQQMAADGFLRAVRRMIAVGLC